MSGSSHPGRLEELMQRLMERTAIASRSIGSTAASRVVVYSQRLLSRTQMAGDSVEADVVLGELLKASILDQQLRWNLPDLRHEHIVDEFQIDEAEPKLEPQLEPAGGSAVDSTASQTVLRPPENLSMISFVLSGDRGAGKSTFVAALCSGASPILQALRIHRAQFHNCWFGLGSSPERVLSRLVAEIDGSLQVPAVSAEEGEGHVARRLGPWLATELSFGTLELEPSEVMYFLDDDELAARNGLLFSQGLLSAAADPASTILYAVPTRSEERELEGAGPPASRSTLFNHLMGRASTVAQRRLQPQLREGEASGPPQHAAIRLVEIGGDLLESLSAGTDAERSESTAPSRKPFLNSSVQLQVHRAVVEAMGGGTRASNDRPQALGLTYFVNAETSLSSDEQLTSLFQRLRHFCALGLGSHYHGAAERGTTTVTVLLSLLISKLPPMSTMDSSVFASTLIHRLPAGQVTTGEELLSVLRRLRDLATRSLERQFPHVCVELDVTTVSHIRPEGDKEGRGVQVDFTGVLTTAHRIFVRTLAADVTVGADEQGCVGSVVSCAAQILSLMLEHRLPWISRRLLRHLLFDEVAGGSSGGCCGGDGGWGGHLHEVKGTQHLHCGAFSLPIHPLSTFVDEVAACGSAMYVLDQYEAAAALMAKRHPDNFTFLAAEDDGAAKGVVDEGALLVVLDTEVARAIHDHQNHCSSAIEIVKAHRISPSERETAAGVLNTVLEALLAHALQ